MINRGSEKISCEEVEDLVYRYDSFDLAAAVAMLEEHGETAHRIGRIEAGEGEAEVRMEGLSAAWPN